MRGGSHAAASTRAPCASASSSPDCAGLERVRGAPATCSSRSARPRAFRRRQGHAHDRRQARGRHRRGHDGRRHRDELRERRHPGAPEGRRRRRSQRGLATIRKNYEASVAKGRITAGGAGATLALITPTTTYDGFDGVDIVVEARVREHGPEDGDVRAISGASRGPTACWRRTPRRSTSTCFAQARADVPAQVIGHHFFSPANVMKLLEIVRGRETERASRSRPPCGWARSSAKVRRGRRQLLRLRRQPDARLLHARGVPAARRRARPWSRSTAC